MICFNSATREKSSTGSHSEFGFNPEGAMRKTVGLSHASRRGE